MITISLLSIIYAITGWVVIYQRNRRNPQYSVNIFDRPPTAAAILLLLTTVYGCIITVWAIVKYLP